MRIIHEKWDIILLLCLDVLVFVRLVARRPGH